jgi:hypothetical protein
MPQNRYIGWYSVERQGALIYPIIFLRIITGAIYALVILKQTTSEGSWQRIVFPLQILLLFLGALAMAMTEVLYGLWTWVVTQSIFVLVDIILGLYDVSFTQSVVMFVPSLALMTLPDALLLWIDVRALISCYKPIGKANRYQPVRITEEERQGENMAEHESGENETSEGEVPEAGLLAEEYHLQSSRNTYGTVGRQALSLEDNEIESALNGAENADPDDILRVPGRTSSHKPSLWVFRPVSQLRENHPERRPLLADSNTSQQQPRPGTAPQSSECSADQQPSMSLRMSAHHTVADDGPDFDIFLLSIFILSLIYIGLVLFSIIRWHILDQLHPLALLIFIVPVLSIIFVAVTIHLLRTSQFQHPMIQRRRTRLCGCLLAIAWINSTWCEIWLNDGPPVLARTLIVIAQAIICFSYAGSAMYPRREWERAWAVVDEMGTVVESIDMHGGWR